MNIVQNKVDDLNLELTLDITKDDYSDRRKKRLNAQKRTAEIKGFRKGMVPMSLIERIYGQSALVDAVNDVISESLNNFIKENNLKVVGEPLPSEDQPKTEWENGNDFTFKFDVATAPEVNFSLSKDDSLPYYEIEVSDEARKEMKENLLKQYGSLEDGDAAKAEDFITALVNLQKECGVDNLKMSDYGFEKSEAMTLAINARETMGGLFLANPAPMSDEECAGIFEKAYR